MSKVLILYVPVLHLGYIRLFEKYNKEIRTLYILSEELVSAVSGVKEIRALDPKTIKGLISGLNFLFRVEVLTQKKARKIPPSFNIITSSDSTSTKFVKKYFPKNRIIYDTVFLGWDEKKVKSPLPTDYDLETSDEFDLKMMKLARLISQKSSDWWRRVGAVIVKNRKVIIKAYNKYLPSEHSPYIDGNPRDFIKAGTLAFLATSVHAEQSAISEAARLGKSLKGADLYLNSYPCPTCAKLMGLAGIKRCFFSGGNAYLNVGEVLKEMGVKAILVKEN